MPWWNKLVDPCASLDEILINFVVKIDFDAAITFNYCPEASEELIGQKSVLSAFQAGWQKRTDMLLAGGVRTDPLLFYNKQSSWIGWLPAFN